MSSDRAVVWRLCCALLVLLALPSALHADDDRVGAHFGFVLPFATRAAWTPPTGSPLAWLLVALVMAIGLPFFALATTASVLQHWFGRTDHAAAGDPYFLYVASNVGSQSSKPVTRVDSLPAAIFPFQRTMQGTRMPPS